MVSHHHNKFAKLFKSIIVILHKLQNSTSVKILIVKKFQIGTYFKFIVLILGGALFIYFMKHLK
jgi:hypothetical protein